MKTIMEKWRKVESRQEGSQEKQKIFAIMGIRMLVKQCQIGNSDWR
jgi:hypothetical protein